jgi:hypothetical protein
MKSSRREKKNTSSDFGISKWSGCPNDEREKERGGDRENLFLN